MGLPKSFSDYYQSHKVWLPNTQKRLLFLMLSSQIIRPKLVTLKVLNDITIARDSKQCCAAIFIDLAKAFDTVDHSILVGRLRNIGVSEGSLAWFANYLSQRVQCIKSDLLSQPLPVTKGVPQGSMDHAFPRRVHRWRTCVPSLIWSNSNSPVGTLFKIYVNHILKIDSVYRLTCFYWLLRNFRTFRHVKCCVLETLRERDMTSPLLMNT